MTPEYKRYAAASPITYVTTDDPPFLIFQGDADQWVPFEQSQLMEAALKKVRVTVKVIPVSGGAHARNFLLDSGDARLSGYFAEAVKWFNDTLRKDAH
jgi:dipeptidyl aminopeptidase/acylaminoacyl peptidase